MKMNEESELPVWRSLLFVPANVPRFVEKAASCGADAIIVDLEDSVPLDAKDVARGGVAGTVRAVGAGGADVLVRVNQPLELCVRDFEAAIAPEVRALVLPKTESAGHVQLLAELADRIERKKGMRVGHTRFVVAVESPGALEQICAIAAAHSRNVAIIAGGEDFALATGSIPTPETMLYPRQRSVIAASCAGLLPLGLISSVADFNDADAYRAAIARSRSFGLRGSTCIHPKVVPLLNAGFRPGDDELAAARRVVDAFVQATEAGRASLQVDGKMVDYPIYERALRLIEVDARIRARESRGAH
ncbi:CoA ester lyase [Pigmentiphaga soli]|uniref:CoA ester lyase n=1 Tax=Pigmentiphaga soli TaxID=1007095 RepID=A0ABP8GEU1_9BURK